MRAVAFALPLLIASFASAAHVTVSAVADRTAIEPGGTATIALKFKIDPGWHLYWINPGDTGLPPRVKWTLPPGVTAGPLKFPTPQRIDGPVTAFGYHDDLVLLVDLKAGPDVKTAVDIAGKVSWVVCADECVAETQAVSLTLPIGPLTLKAVNEFKSWTADQPARPADAAALTALIAADGKTGTIDLPLPAGKTGVDFFPPKSDSISYDRPTMDGGVFRARFHILSGTDLPSPGVGLVTWKDEKTGKLTSEERPVAYRFAKATSVSHKE